MFDDIDIKAGSVDRMYCVFQEKEIIRNKKIRNLLETIERLDKRHMKLLSANIKEEIKQSKR